MTQPTKSNKPFLTHSQGSSTHSENMYSSVKTLSHYRSQTYPIQNNNSNSKTSQSPVPSLDSVSQLSMENQTVIVKDCQSIGSLGKENKEKKPGGLVRLQVGHQMRCY